MPAASRREQALTAPTDRRPAPGGAGVSGPVRTCVGCRTRRPATDLVRCALGSDGKAVCSRVAAGRGAWLCAGSIECFDTAVRRRGFDRAWRRAVDPAVLSELRGAFQALAGRMGPSQAAGVSGAPAAATKD